MSNSVMMAIILMKMVAQPAAYLKSVVMVLLK